MLVAERTSNDYFLSFLPTVNSPPVPHRDITGVSATSYRPYNEEYASVQRHIDRPQPELDIDRSKKDKKWSIGKLFRRKKKEEESGSSSQSDEGGRSPSKRKSKKKKRAPAVNNFDHIVIRDTRRAQSLAKPIVRDITDDGILSDPSAGFLNYQPRVRDTRADQHDYLFVKDESNIRPEKMVLDTSTKKSRKSRLKARVEALRNSMRGDSSSDEESLKSSNSSSMLRFRSDDSLMRSRDSSLNKRTRSARNERYIKRLSRDEEHQLNKEAELLQQGYSKAEVEMLTRTPTSQSSGYGTCKRENTNKAHTEQLNDLNRRTMKSESVSSFPSTQSYPSSINFNAKVNNEHINYSIKYPNNNIHRDLLHPNSIRERTPSINQYEDPNNVMCVKFPLGNVNNVKTEEKAPPVPPPRDMQRKVVTPISMYHDTSSLGGNMMNTNQQNVLHGVPNNDFERIMRRSQERTIGSGFNGLRRPISNSEDHIAMQNNEYLQNYNYRNEQPRRPASVSAEPNHYGMYMNSPMWKKRLEQNKIMRPEAIQVNQDYLYYADQTPRSRRPISIKTSQGGFESQYLSDSQTTSNLMDNIYRRPRNASEFWKKIDDAEKQRRQQTFVNSRGSSDYSSSTQLNKIFLDKTKVNDRGQNRDVSETTHTTQSKPPETRSWKATTEYKRSVTVEPPKSNTSPVLKTHTRHKSDTFIPNSYQVPSDEEGSERRKSTNLDDALNELEAIYNSLGLGDEDLLDRAERRELMTPKFNDRCNDWNGNDDNIKLQSQPSTPLRRISRRSTLPDKLQDDMAFRRLNSTTNKEKPNYKDTQAQISYMLASPVYVPYASDDDRQSDRNEPDIIHDDVVYRNIKQTNSRLRTVDPQPPFGIPVGPVSPAPQSDYLHATPENKGRSRFIPKRSPDIVADDLAYRSLRKDSRHSTLFNGDEYSGLINNNHNYTEFPFTNNSTNNIKKKRAVRSLSANIFTMIQKEIDDAINMTKKPSLQKTNSNSDVMRRLRDTFENNDNQRDCYPRNKVKQRHNTVNLFANNTHTPTHHFAKDDSFIHNENKCLAKSSSCDKSTTSSPSNKSPQASKRSSKDEFQQVLSMLAQEAMDTSNKLGVALAELDKNRSKNDLLDTHNKISDSRINFLNSLTNSSNNDVVSELKNNELNHNKIATANSPNEINEDQETTGKKTEDSLLKISNQLHKVEDRLKHSYEKEINFDEESSRLTSYVQKEKEDPLKVKETVVAPVENQFQPDIIPVKVQNDTKMVEIPPGLNSNTDLPSLKFHPSNPFLCSDDKVKELNEIKAFKELKDGISDLIAGITEVNDKIFISKTAQKATTTQKEAIDVSTTDSLAKAIANTEKDIPERVNIPSYAKEDKPDDADSTEYNSSEELATIFKFEDRVNKSIIHNNNDPDDEKRPDLSSPKLVRTMNQQLRRLSVDENTACQSNSLPSDVVPWRAKRQNNNSQNDHKGSNTKSKRNWHDSGTLMLACSYTVMLSQHLADLDWLMLLGLLLAMITIIAMLLI
ncbi:homeobox protein 2-like isoform X1 [Colias croceus]|uniref:homeobox protein 2-like isoform X1 n=1 Tax=Colias crocea TaxID=72248 RepID=UPI001E27EE74|nr:homeobox protein 2-like isoform X1 [Colias croceus]